MFLTRHFVFLHVPRTGGNFVRALLEGHAPAEWQVQRHSDHATAAEIPPSRATLPRLAFVRNPYDWYVSWFHFQQRTRDPFFLEISDGGRLPFPVAMRRALNSRVALAQGEGPYTQTIRSILGRDYAGIRIGRFDRIRADLQQMLTAVAEIPAAMRDAIRTMPPQNASDHEHWSRYYDAELRALVAEKDREAVEFFGYGREQATG